MEAVVVEGTGEAVVDEGVRRWMLCIREEVEGVVCGVEALCG